MGRLLLHAHAAAVQGVVAAALATGTFVVSADRTVGGLPVGRGTVAQAVARFGAPTTQRSTGGGVTCVVTWKRLGLTMSFLDFADHACRDGGVGGRDDDVDALAHGLGLRVGDSVARLRSLYPKAPFRTGPAGFWLVTRHACTEVGGQAYPGLLARARSGHVTALVATAGVCE